MLPIRFLASSLAFSTLAFSSATSTITSFLFCASLDLSFLNLSTDSS